MAIRYKRTSSKDGGILSIAVMKVNYKQLFNYFTTLLYSAFLATHISRSSQCSTTGVTKAVVCAILSVGWCI